MKTCKKILCVMLTLLMCFSIVPVIGISFEAEAAKQTLYRYRTKEYLTSSNAIEEGYTLYSSEWAEEPSESKTVTYAKAWPNGSSTTKGFKTNNSLYKKYQKPTTNENETTKTVLGDESKAKTVGYLYWHWCYTHDAEEILNCVIRDNKNGKVEKYNSSGNPSGYYYTTNFHAFYTSSALTYNADALAYKKSSSSYCDYTYWWSGLTFGKKGNIEVISNTLYTYEKVYNHYKWSDWSEWSTTPAQESENVEVETWEVSVNLCGDNAYWTFDEATGTLTISGEGSTYNYQCYGTELEDILSPFDNNNGIRKVVIEEGITTIGDYLLHGCCNIEEIQIPETVTYIGMRAVDGKMEEFHIGKNIAYIDGTIEELNCIKKFTADAENENYSADEFGCLYNKDKTSLEAYPANNEATEFDIPESVEFVNASFYGANNLETVFVHANVSNLVDGIFTTAFNLKQIIVDSGNENYFNDDYGALYNINSETEEIILKCYPTGNTRTVFEIADGTTTIWHSVFNGDTSINTLIIPTSVTRMVWGALQCYNLSDIYYYGTEEQWNQIDIDEFNDADLEDVTIHFNYKKDDSVITKSGYCGENVTYELTSDGTLTISGTGPMYDYSWEDNDGSGMPPYITWEYEEIDGEMWIAGDETIRKVIIEDGVTTIGDYAFNACTALESVKIGNMVTSVGAVSFDCCINLKEVILPDSVTIIKEEAFSESGLEKITLSKNLETIEQIAFLLCENLKEVVVPESVTSIGMVAFAMCTSLESITILNKDCELDNTFIINATIDEETGEMIPAELETVLRGYTDSTAQRYAEMYTSAGYPIKFEAIDAHEHTLATETKEANCIEDGYIITRCSSCGELISHEVVYAYGHKFEVKQTIVPTCTAAGFTLYECTNPGCNQEKTDNYTTALGHSYTQKIIDDAHLVSSATYERAAVYKYDCSRCDSMGTTTFEHGDKLIKEEENKNCSCNCHKGGILGFFFKIILFFQKLFRTNKTCACGINHY